MTNRLLTEDSDHGRIRPAHLLRLRASRMMPSRKRRNSPYSTPPTRPSKRPKLPPRTSRSKGRKRDPGRDQANGADPERLYEIKDILDEKGGKYRIDWEGIDPNTGKRYKPTWVSLNLTIYCVRSAPATTIRSYCSLLNLTFPRRYRSRRRTSPQMRLLLGKE